MTDADQPPTTPRAWHVPPALLARFADDSGTVDDVIAASIDAHLLACAECRHGLTAVAAPGLAATSWAAVADRIDRPRTTVLERILRRLIGVLRSRGRWSRAREAVAATVPEFVMAAEDQVLIGVEHGDLAGALRGLSPELRAVVQATVLDGLTTREAARLLGIPAGTVKTRMMRARVELRGALA